MKTKKQSDKPWQFKPGNKHAWKPGQSGGGQGGRKSKHEKALAREFGAQVNPKTGRSKNQHLFEVLYRQGCQGNVRAAELYLSYAVGKPVQYNVTAEWSVDTLRESLEAGMKRVQAAQAIPVPLLEAENTEAAKAAKAEPADQAGAIDEPVSNAQLEAPRQPVFIERERPPQNIHDALNRRTRDPQQIGESFGSWRH